jgi:hypothetical protein
VLRRHGYLVVEAALLSIPTAARLWSCGWDGSSELDMKSQPTQTLHFKTSKPVP